MLLRAGALLVLAIAALAVAQPVLPVQPSYATSGSMSPAIEVGDLYFVVRTDDVDVGDVITFYSEKRGKYITHRAVDETAQGFITRGDDNPSTDQEAGLPPIDDSALLGRVIEFNGKPLTIGAFGSIAAALQKYRLPLLGLAVVLILTPLVLPETGRRRPDRDVTRMGDVLRPLFVMALVLGLLLPVIGASSHELLFVATETGVGPPQVVPVGESVEKTVVVETWVPPFTTTIIESKQLTVLDRQVVETGIELSVNVPAYETVGPRRYSVAVRAYPSTLPESILERLTAIHWTVALVVSLLPVFLPLLAIYLVVMDGGAPVRPPRSRWLHRRGD